VIDVIVPDGLAPATWRVKSEVDTPRATAETEGMANEPCCEYCELGKPVIAVHPDPYLSAILAERLRFEPKRTLTHDAKALVIPGLDPGSGTSDVWELEFDTDAEGKPIISTGRVVGFQTGVDHSPLLQQYTDQLSPALAADLAAGLESAKEPSVYLRSFAQHADDAQ
jgi:hypothetical protein